jgi:hypothetical protein
VESRIFRLKRACLLAGLLVLFVGCAGTPPPKVTVDAADVQQQFQDKTVAQALEETEAAMTRAEKDELAFYSPGFFATAQKALKEAQFLALAPKEPNADAKSAEQEIFTKLSLANKSLARAESTKPEVQKRLKDILAVRDSLISKGIDQSNADEYTDVMGVLVGLFKRVERKDWQGFDQARAVALLQFRRLESQSVKAVQLEQPIAVLEKAEAIGAGGAAPKSYKKTQQALENAQAVIERDPNNAAAIKAAVEQFAFEADHLLHVTEEVKELRELNRAAMENILLAAETRLLAISDALRQPDPRHHTLHKQTEMIAAAADELFAKKNTGSAQVRTRPVNKNELETALLHVAQLEAQMRELQAQNTQLQNSNKPLLKRIDALERVVIKLNDEKAELEAELAMKTAPPADGVEITPIVKP